MPPILLFAIGALCAYATYRFLRAEAKRAAALHAEASAMGDIETLVRDPDTGIYRPPGPRL